MFSGIITDIGIIHSYERTGDDVSLVVKTNLPPKSYQNGASIACSGICLTVTQTEEGCFYTDASAETLSKTTMGRWTEGMSINLESSLHLGDEMCGHMAFGHVDTHVEVFSIQPDGDSYRLQIKAPQEIMKFIAPKGTVCLDGISLTVNEVEENVFGVNIIPYTWTHTTLSQRHVGDHLNLEVDMLARYVARILDFGGQI